MKHPQGRWILVFLLVGTSVMGGAFWWTLSHRQIFQDQVKKVLIAEILEGPWKQLGLPSRSLKSLEFSGDSLVVKTQEGALESSAVKIEAVESAMAAWAKLRLGAEAKPLKIQIL
ncbi:MAG: hypothetical protein WCH11_07865 [Bdellovibrio sp.]